MWNYIIEYSDICMEFIFKHIYIYTITHYSLYKYM